MKTLFATAVLIAAISPVHTCMANDAFSSEFSHVAGGMVLASGVTSIADHYHVEKRGWVGFWVSTGLGVLAEAIQMASDDDATLSSAALDAGSNMIGAAIGAYVTDRYILMPVIKKDAAGHSVFGISAWHSF